jgi:hypothetical protein
MHDLEARNLREIELLNQRGGRMLTLVDLIEAGTVSSAVAAFMLNAIAQGASVLMAAGEGGAGKTTLLANSLVLLPPGERVVTVSSTGVLERALERPAVEAECYLAHEIGPGDWYGYLWGWGVRQFFELLDTGRRIATSLHADSLEEAEHVLSGPPCFVGRETLSRLGLVGFIKLVRPGMRRLTYLYGRAPGRGPQLAFRWRAVDDSHDPVSSPEVWGIDPERYEQAARFFAELSAAEVRDLAALRQAVREFYARQGW